MPETPVETDAAVTGLGRERAEMQREIEGLRALVARLGEQLTSAWNCAKAQISASGKSTLAENFAAVGVALSLKEAVAILVDPSAAAALAWHEAEVRKAVEAERTRCADKVVARFYQRFLPDTDIDIAWRQCEAAIRTPEPAREESHG